LLNINVCFLSAEIAVWLVFFNISFKKHQTINVQLRFGVVKVNGGGYTVWEYRGIWIVVLAG